MQIQQPRRTWILRTSIFINAAIIFYLASYYTTYSRNGSFDLEEELHAQRISRTMQPSLDGQGTTNVQSKTTRISPTPPKTTDDPDKDLQQQPQEGAGMSNNNLVTAQNTASDWQQREAIPCNDKDNSYKIAQKGDFWALYNYAPAARSFKCYESVTYTTHADFTFVDNLPPLVERWRGPVSLALYAPGTDFIPTLDSIRYLRKCYPLVAEFATFHVYFESKHVPKWLPRPERAMDKGMDCDGPAPWTNATSRYRAAKKLQYPVNVGRNIARDAAQTHYILASDIELYPSPGIIDDFLDMIGRKDAVVATAKPKVFVLCLFEVESYVTPPNTKKDLVTMLKNKTAIPFHKYVCPDCHSVPKSKEWIAAPIKDGLRVFHIGKRNGRYVHWEPIFIGTNNDPYYDERLSWEGKSDKMTQGYALCVLDYEFHILDNAFLVHRPGIKRFKPDKMRAMASSRTQAIIKQFSYPELKLFYGVRRGCIV